MIGWLLYGVLLAWSIYLIERDQRVWTIEHKNLDRWLRAWLDKGVSR